MNAHFFILVSKTSKAIEGHFLSRNALFLRYIFVIFGIYVDIIKTQIFHMKFDLRGH